MGVEDHGRLPAPHQNSRFNPFYLDQIEIAVPDEPAGITAEPQIIKDEPYDIEEIPLTLSTVSVGVYRFAERPESFESREFAFFDPCSKMYFMLF